MVQRIGSGAKRMAAFRLLPALSLLSLAALPTPAKASPPPQEAKPVEVTDDMRAAARSGNEFAFDLYGRLKGGEGNLFFSPASISTALAMTYAGAAGQTEREMAGVLHFDLPQRRLHAAYGTLGEVLNASNKNYQLSTANRLWAAKTFPFRPEYLTLTRQSYGAELAQLDFARTEEARRTINGWVEQRTNNRIQDLIPPGVLERYTRLVLTNAIYFKGNWADEFHKGVTEDQPFRLVDGGKTNAPLMRQTNDFRYGEADGLQLVELSYAGGDLSMLILLPREVGLEPLEKQLTAENVERWSSEMGSREVELYLPRFKTTSQFRLSQTLAAMGMPLAFSDDADFSGMSSAEALKISEVVHKAFVEVNEQGTEAAAATGVVLAPTSAAPGVQEPPVVFRADRPFAFLIRDGRTGAILFLGRVADPTK
jgi:serpin B